MMYDWKVRPVSEATRRVALAWLLPVLLTVAAPGLTSGAEPAPDLTLAQAGAADPRVADWLDQDRAWLRTLPGAPFTEGGLRQWVAARGAAGDTLIVARTPASLLLKRWQDRGYLAARVLTDSSAAREAGLILDPGPRYHLGSVQVAGKDFPGRQGLLDLWLPRAGSPFTAGPWDEAVEKILVGTGEAGYPFARWITSQVSLEPENALVHVEATLLPGAGAVVGPITSDLPAGRPARFLARASGLRRGQPFRHSEMERARDRLLARDLYSRVGDPQVYPTSHVDTVGIHFPVTARQRANRLQVVLGLSRKQDDEASRLSGEVDLRLPNMAGSGRNLGFNWRDDGASKRHFGLDYLEPLALGTPLDMSVSLDSEVLEESYTRLRLDNRWQLGVVALWGVELGLGRDRSTYPTGDLERSSRTRVRGAFLHRRGDPSASGWSGVFAIETAWRSSVERPADDEVNTAAASLGQDATQRIYQVDVDGEWWLSRSLSLAGRAAFRQLDADEEVVPLAEQFSFGGASTLRGYREDEFHGSEAAWGGLEARIGRAGGSRLYTFYDLGYFGFATQETLPEDQTRLAWKSDWPRGYGLGLLARTQAGDISLAVGFPGTVDFEVAKLHVTLMESF